MFLADIFLRKFSKFENVMFFSLCNQPKTSIPLAIIHKLRLINQSPLGSVTRPCPFLVMRNGHGRASLPRRYMIEIIGAHDDGPIRKKMTLLTTNEITGLFIFYRRSLIDTLFRDFICKLRLLN